MSDAQKKKAIKQVDLLNVLTSICLFEVQVKSTHKLPNNNKKFKTVEHQQKKQKLGDNKLSIFKVIENEIKKV